MWWPSAVYSAVYFVIRFIIMGVVRIFRSVDLRGFYVGDHCAVSAVEAGSDGVYRVGLSIFSSATFVRRVYSVGVVEGPVFRAAVSFFGSRGCS